MKSLGLPTRLYSGGFWLPCQEVLGTDDQPINHVGPYFYPDNPPSSVGGAGFDADTDPNIAWSVSGYFTVVGSTTDEGLRIPPENLNWLKNTGSTKQSMILAFRIKAVALPSGNRFFIGGRDNAFTGNESTLIVIANASGQITVNGNDGTSYRSVCTTSTDGIKPIEAGVEHDVIVCVDSEENTIHVFVDGEIDLLLGHRGSENITLSFTGIHGAAPFCIGRVDDQSNILPASYRDIHYLCFDGPLPANMVELARIYHQRPLHPFYESEVVK